jgi:hypothetical protein
MIVRVRDHLASYYRRYVCKNIDKYISWLTEMERRNFALDTLCGVAAIGILIWHYQHFFAIGKFT